MKTWWLVIVLGSVALVTRPAGPQVPKPQAVFRAGVDYVLVDVVVTDDNDRPITDLTKDDFELVERGRLQSINDFQFVSVPTEPRATRVNEPAVPPPDIATNAATSPKSRLFAMVVDDLHIVESDVISLKTVMTEFIRALSPDDELAVVFVGRSNLSQNFTSDRGLLLKTVDRVREVLGFGLDSLGRFSTSAVVPADPRITLRYAKTADLVLKNVALSLAGSGHSRRAIVYVTGGSIVETAPARGGDFDELQDVYETARRANVPIYTLDPRGQVLPEDAIRGGIGIIASDSLRTAIAANIKKQQDRLAEVAVNTGGRAFTSQSDLMRAVTEIVADNGSYYLLGYYPSPFEADGKFHTLTVRVKRPGVRIRARSGYMASKIGTAIADAKPVLDAAMSAGVNVSAITLRAFAAPMSAGAKGMNTVVTVDVTYPPRPDGSRQIDDDLRVSILALDPDAKVKASSERTLHFKGTAPDLNSVTMLIDDVIDLPSERLTLRIGVASRVLGKAGTVQMPIDVPRLSDDRLQLSGIAIAVAGVPAPAMNAAAIASLVPFQPTTARTHLATDTLRVFGRAFWRSRDAPVMTIAIRTVPSSLKQPTLTISPGIKGGQQAAFDATVPLTGLAPGRYVLEIIGRLAGGKPVTREVPFSVR